jgi:LmbE family N-acetylglucosaminyl deacetylase
MMQIELISGLARPARVLALGAHCDDIEIGCGGTILHLLHNNPRIHIDWIVFASSKLRAKEARLAARKFLRDAEAPNVVIQEFRDGYFPAAMAEIKDFFESLKSQVAPDLILTHYRQDLHQDHRLISDLTWNTFRNHLILEYEIPKYDGDLSAPNLFVCLDESTCLSKVRYIANSYRSQSGKHWFSPEIFLSLLRLRGVESRSPTGYAEAFYGRKMVMR